MSSLPGKRRGSDQLKLAFGVIALAGLGLFLLVLMSSGSDNNVGGPVDDDESSWIVVATILTAVFGGLGFVTTSVFAWRKDRRDSQQAALQMQKLSLEISQMQGPPAPVEQPSQEPNEQPR